MSGMTQFVVAKRGEEKAISNHEWPIDKWVGCDGFKFFGADELGHLHAAALGGSETYQHFPILLQGDTGWILEVPAALVKSLAEADDGMLSGFANGWSVRLAEGLRKKYESEDLLGLLREIRKVAAEAHRLGQPAFVWHSLAC
jgi:hypothetical protein